MRILIDVQSMQNSSANRAIGRYTHSLVKAILENKNDHEVFLLLNGLFSESIDPVREEFKNLLPEHHFIIFSSYEPADALNILNEWNVKSSELCREKLICDLKPDFLIISNLFAGALDNTITSVGKFPIAIPTAVILYDFIPLISPDKYNNCQPSADWYYDKIDSLKRADILLAISESAKNEVVEKLNIDKDEIVNISSTVDTKKIIKKDISNYFKKKFGITKPFLMYSSAYKERKIFEDLIEAFSMIESELRKDYQLVLVCKLDKDQERLLKLHAKKYDLGDDDLILTGFISDDDLVYFYSECHFFISPSLREKIGLPLLEEMSCGAATIVSNADISPEVIGRSDVLFDPYSPKDIAEKITAVLINNDLLDELKDYAMGQEKKISWGNSAKIAINFLEKKSINSNYNSIRENSEILIEKLSLLKDSKNRDRWSLAKLANIIDANEKEVHKLESYTDFGTPLTWRVEGPFDSSYSIALLNREISRSLEELGHTVVLHSTEGLGDFLPDENFLHQNGDLNKMYKRVPYFSHDKVDVVSRNIYPPRVNDMRGKINFLHNYAWEESSFPEEWVLDFNKTLQGINCASKHVKKIMIDNGVTTYLTISGNGVDHWTHIFPDIKFKFDDTHRFRFLHVSSCFPRKGADVLLKAYGDAFTSQDDVVLIIKTFENPHNEIDKWLKDAQQNSLNYPDVLIIKKDMKESELKALYECCDALVAPSRAEGFGLPFAEAMLSGLPVITTGWSGQLDFCTPDTAWLIDYTFAPAKTHFNLFNSVWAEPSQSHLASLMMEVYKLPLDKRLEKSIHGKNLLLKNFKWIDIASKIVISSKIVKEKEQNTKPNIGWVTTWNTKCGIAIYSEHLINSMGVGVSILSAYTTEKIKKDDENVYRCWRTEDTNDFYKLNMIIDDLKIDTLVIQFQYGFYNFHEFNIFLNTQIKRNCSIIIMIHATQDAKTVPYKQFKQLVDNFKICDRLLVHSIDDLNRLKGYGLVDNVSLFPHGILDWKNENKEKKNFIFTITSYGFFLPHKGLLELIDAVGILVKKGINIQLKMFNAKFSDPSSSSLIDNAKNKILEQNLTEYIKLKTDFLTDEESLLQLIKSDLIIFPYQNTGESASGAVRYGLVAEKPIAVTPLDIFNDVEDVVFKLPGVTPDKIADGIEYLMNEIQQKSKLIKQNKLDADKWRQAHRYSGLGLKLTNILISLHNQKGRI